MQAPNEEGRRTNAGANTPVCLCVCVCDARRTGESDESERIDAWGIRCEKTANKMRMRDKSEGKKGTVGIRRREGVGVGSQKKGKENAGLAEPWNEGNLHFVKLSRQTWEFAEEERKWRTVSEGESGGGVPCAG